MYYNKIKILSEKRKVSVKDLAYKINVTEAGLHKMIKNESMKIDLLEKIADVLEVPVSYFFDESGVISEKTQINTNGHNLSGTNNGNITLSDCTQQLELMKKENQGLQKEVELLRKMIAMLEGK